MVQQSEWVTYVENPPENTCGVYCTNVILKEYRDDAMGYIVRFHRPVAVGTIVPKVVNFKRHNTYTTIVFDDDCICHCYYNKEPIRAHRRLDRYSPDDSFQFSETDGELTQL